MKRGAANEPRVTLGFWGNVPQKEPSRRHRREGLRNLSPQGRGMPRTDALGLSHHHLAWLLFFTDGYANSPSLNLLFSIFNKIFFSFWIFFFLWDKKKSEQMVMSKLKALWDT